jgi:hypothetical protein
MNGRKIVAALAVAAGLTAVAVANGAHAAAPVAAPIQTDYSDCIGTATGGGYITCQLASVVANDSDAKAFSQLKAPSGGLVNLPTSSRFLGFVFGDDPETPGVGDEWIVGTRWRWFGHQLVRDANGNYRQNAYNGPITFSVRVTSRTDYCQENACS